MQRRSLFSQLVHFYECRKEMGSIRERPLFRSKERSFYALEKFNSISVPLQKLKMQVYNGKISIQCSLSNNIKLSRRRIKYAVGKNSRALGRSGPPRPPCVRHRFTQIHEDAAIYTYSRRRAGDKNCDDYTAEAKQTKSDKQQRHPA
ncbi:hypothetical protein TNCV_2486081 [Trichonephila clavipes]|uniref:Uncharacterized protein n=1 Tax=Trichonephila clavipes TaxID=2585209 RepID=A0A8X7BB92_TRICX|nr:hypothetical protein TNCV_2486081 [Trichonephila clavipes]